MESNIIEVKIDKGVIIVKAVIKDEVGQVLQVIELNPKTFKTGSRGYHGYGKLSVNGSRYQANLMLVEIGSKKAKKS